MLWKTECQRVEQALALQPEQPVAPAQLAKIERHIHVCPQCRGFRDRLKTCQRVLEQVRSQAPAEPGLSLWPALKSRIESARTEAERSTSWGWIPAAGLSAACLLVLAVGFNSPFYWGAGGDVMNVALDPDNTPTYTVRNSPYLSGVSTDPSRRRLQSVVPVRDVDFTSAQGY